MSTVPPDPHRVGTPAQRALTAALAAAGRGWPVFPVRRQTKTPAIRDWENQATLDPERINGWWSTSDRNVGVACGPAGLVVIDLDTSNGDAAPPQWAQLGAACGADVFAILAARAGHPHPADTHSVRTPHKGRHLYFAAPVDHELRNTAAKLGWRVDTRAAGGFVLAAGSVLRVGARLVPYQTVHDVPTAPLPTWLCHALARPEPPERSISPGPQHASAYVRAAIRGESDAVAAARPGVRNSTLFRAAASLGRLVGAGLLDEATATSSLASAAAPHVGVDGFTAGEVQRAIANGIARGSRQPRGRDSG